MHRLHKVDEQDAARITKEETDEESQSINEQRALLDI